MEAIDILMWIFAVVIFAGLFAIKSKKYYGFRRKEPDKDSQGQTSRFSPPR